MKYILIGYKIIEYIKVKVKSLGLQVVGAPRISR